jgi:nitroreductase
VDVDEAIRTRRTVHRMQPRRELPEGALERALQAAHQAPNHRFTYPWRFSLVGPETRAKLAEVAVEIKGRKRELTPEVQDKVRGKVVDPSAAIVLRQVLHDDLDTREEDYASLACAAQNLMLSLWSSGVCSKWTTGGVTRDPATYALLGIDPGRERIVGFLWAGYPAVEPTPPPRPGLGEFVTRLP